MTALRDPFEVTHDKGGFTYVSWSQVADRLDEGTEPWSFAIMQLGPDWCHGRLTIGDRFYENVGYAENADAEWKKEPYKDAVSDAFKRCAALAGVARYLYDKDSPSGTGRVASPPPARPAAATHRRPEIVKDMELKTGRYEGEDPYEDMPAPWESSSGQQPVDPRDGGACPDHELAWVLKPGGTSKTTGKPYDAFWACPSDERPFCKNKPSRAWQARHEG
jgi:hypothetical protein